ncbi:hypothetical protein [Porphyrobacter sp. LM 6]|jgi:hypothetical protein|uniref:hypothetical protein n=1 Tax=Porphyrobacter sp. LM 6 TaxID=1896196 RepID=UPI000846ECB5|nr:hypothetical protein [Porphyrobacter sp. LM 6]AOL95529.1 hypothetical protein BG023_112619 [Porphyrobacter sp. LM 6]
MSSWAIVALVGIIVIGLVEFAKTRAGIVKDKHGNEQFAPRDNGQSDAELEAARRELSELRERVKVLERIATDSNTGEAREQARIAAEIEALRGLPAARQEKSE